MLHQKDPQHTQSTAGLITGLGGAHTYSSKGKALVYCIPYLLQPHRQAKNSQHQEPWGDLGLVLGLGYFSWT